MRFERRTERPSGPPAGALFGGVLLVGGALAALWIRLGFPLPVCLFRRWTGLPCPTCGSTRMVESLLAGDLAGAVAWNPLLFLGLATVVAWALLSVARLVFHLPAWRVVLTPRERLVLRFLALAVLVAGWVYLVWRGT